MQYAVVASPTLVDVDQVTDILQNHGYKLLAPEPIYKYPAHEVELWIIANCQQMVKRFGSYCAYQVVGPEHILPLLTFDNVPMILAIRMRAKIWSSLIRKKLNKIK
jgi:hypothetical protein